MLDAPRPPVKRPRYFGLPSRTTLRGLALGALASGGFSCLVRPVPIPPPMAQVQALTDCDGSPECPADGVLVDIVGTATPGALVLIENVSRPLSNGVSYSVSTFASRSAFVPDGGVDGGVDLGPGRFFVRLGPMRAAPTEPVIVSRRGDVLSVRQFVEREAGAYEASSAVTFTVR
jgi:hypothetical protein